MVEISKIKNLSPLGGGTLFKAFKTGQFVILKIFFPDNNFIKQQNKDKKTVKIYKYRELTF